MQKDSRPRNPGRSKPDEGRSPGAGQRRLDTYVSDGYSFMMDAAKKDPNFRRSLRLDSKRSATIAGNYLAKKNPNYKPGTTQGAQLMAGAREFGRDFGTNYATKAKRNAKTVAANKARKKMGTIKTGTLDRPDKQERAIDKTTKRKSK